MDVWRPGCRNSRRPETTNDNAPAMHNRIRGVRNTCSNAARSWRDTDRGAEAGLARACRAYHAWRKAGASDQEAHEAAVAAVQEASIEAVNAVAYATRWKSVRRTELELGYSARR